MEVVIELFWEIRFSPPTVKFVRLISRNPDISMFNVPNLVLEILKVALDTSLKPKPISFFPEAN